MTCAHTLRCTDDYLQITQHEQHTIKKIGMLVTDDYYYAFLKNELEHVYLHKMTHKET